MLPLKTIAVIAEYNPFHQGHAYHLREIRRVYGEDCAIAVIMSGNFTQRGEPAILGKDIRAAMAVAGGASLVLELPFPYCAAPAEFFATAGVRIADAIGVADVLSFGSESGDTALLEAMADRLLSPAFQDAFLSMAAEKGNLGRAACYSAAYRSLFGENGAALLEQPNEILALEYCKALKKNGSSLRPAACRRMGSYHMDNGTETGHYASASYLRTLIRNQDADALSEQYIPAVAAPFLKTALTDGLCPAEETRLDAMILAFFRMFPVPTARFAEAEGGLYRRIAKVAAEAVSPEGLVTAAASAKYTYARVRRAALFSFLGVTPEEIRAAPAFTRVLAMDKTGQKLLKRMKYTSSIPVLTKPAHYRKLPPALMEQAVCANRADSVYAMLLPSVRRADLYIRTSPFCK